IDYKGTNVPNRLPGYYETTATIISRDLVSVEDDMTWSGIFPPNHGFVRLGPHGRPFGLGLYHQLHCLNSIRFSYVTARDRLITDSQTLRARMGHDNHCFQFLRQSLLCHADNDALPYLQNITIVEAGFGHLRRCRDWTQVYQFVVNNDLMWKNVSYAENDE
ncbi:hypothetical protein BDQ17DRAFT_1261726, partial [Cyathus striatus]